MTAFDILATPPGADYALLDSGGGRKLERCGPYRFIRPEPQALWRPRDDEWLADGEFVAAPDSEGGGRWQLRPGLPQSWEVEPAGIKIAAQCTAFRHFAYFPDMAPHWRRLEHALRPGDEVLNLFGYTGVATLVAARAGARVVHVDASRKAVDQARANATLSGLADRPVRWIVEDARRFVAREVRRGRRYAAILLDPPKFGRGPDGETWDLTQHLPELLADCARLLGPESRLLILTTYALRLSALALLPLMQQTLAGAGGRIGVGEMGLVEAERGLLLPTALFARWERD
jgi:23S rRNA (cytosine1962-C5)-methyltransferase